MNTPFVLCASEICLPERSLELGLDSIEAVLAHELAHIERRDGVWLQAALLLQALAWFQPLNRKLRAELLETAELAADDRAVELTGNALGLARTLTQVASWARSAGFVPAVAMARAGSAILVRVERLCESRDLPAPGRFGSRTPWLALAALAAIGACSPSIGAPYAKPSRPTLVPASRPGPSTASPVPELLAPGLVEDAVAGVPRAIELSEDMNRLVQKEQLLQGQISLMEGCTELDADQARAEVALLKEALANARGEHQQLEHELHARMQAWSQQIEQRFEHDRGARMSAPSDVPTALLECVDPGQPSNAPAGSK